MEPQRHRVVLAPPVVRRDGAAFAWRVEPETELYLRCHFELRLPAGLDGRRLPESLWWTIALLCLHAHWNLLRPCTVELPVTLAPGHRELWQRLLASEAATLEAHRQPAAGAAADVCMTAGPAVELREAGPLLAPPERLTEAGRCAAAFSGGKDSLLQAALLAELGYRPVLVPTTSPMPPLHDHVTARRRRVLAEIARRREVEVLEVASDLRSAWRNDFPPRLGFPVSVNEITDTFLYTAALLAVGALRGATHLFLASEAEVQESAEIDGRIVQHPHCMYSAATQAALAALLRPAGLRYGSLVAALPSAQVQDLLWRRYGDLADLQYSCWRVGPGEATCSRCSQCLRLALAALALGESPERMGIDLVRLLPAMRDWTPGAIDGSGALRAPGRSGAARLPADTVRQGLRRQVLRSLAATPTVRVAAALAAGGAGRLLRPAAWRALWAYAHLRRRLVLSAARQDGGVGGAGGVGEAPGYRAGFLRLVDPLVRAPVAAIYAAHFAAERPAAYAGVLARSQGLARWIAAPLAADAAASAATEASAAIAAGATIGASAAIGEAGPREPAGAGAGAGETGEAAA